MAPGELTSFQAAMTSVSAIVGSGNIAGVASALVAGGPGALFWMIVAAMFGMASKFAEITLGIKSREMNNDGEELLRIEIGQYDVIVNCILWDVMRSNHIIYRDDLKRMKKNAMIIDVSCDRNGGNETSVPTTIEEPTYVVDGILHYAVDHTPTIFHKTFTKNNSEVIWQYINELQNDSFDVVMSDALILRMV